MQIDYSDSVNRILVALACGEDFIPPKGAAREAIDDCDSVAIIIIDRY